MEKVVELGKKSAGNSSSVATLKKIQKSCGSVAQKPNRPSHIPDCKRRDFDGLLSHSWVHAEKRDGKEVGGVIL